MSKHTPGPWTGHQSIDPKDIPLKAIYCERLHFSIVFINTDGKRREEEAEANARLIAAAPELLSALIDAVELIEIMSPIEGDTLRRARAAITKATGGCT